MNLQPWSFVAIHAPERLAWFGERYKAAFESRFGSREIDPAYDSPTARTIGASKYQVEHIHEFPLILLVAGKRDWPFKLPDAQRVGLAPPNHGAVYPCVQNILLACRALGLGAALTTMHQSFEDELHEHVEIPMEYGVGVAIPIGYPMGQLGPVSRSPAKELTCFDSWVNTDPDDWR